MRERHQVCVSGFVLFFFPMTLLVLLCVVVVLVDAGSIIANVGITTTNITCYAG